MRGVRRRLEREADNRIELAWYIATMGATAWTGKLEPLEHYKSRKQIKQTPKQMLQVLKDAAARGAPINIREVKRQDNDTGE